MNQSSESSILDRKPALTLCRICAKSMEPSEENDLFEVKNLNILQQLKDLTGITIENISYMPRNICLECKIDLSRAHAFRERFLAAQSYFTSKEVSEPSEGIGTLLEFNSVYIPSAQIDMEIKLELMAESNSDNEGDCDDLKISDDESTHESTTDVLRKSIESLDTFTKTKTVNTRKTRSQKTKPKELKFKKVKLKMPPPPKSVKINLLANNSQLSEESKPNIYICDQCGNRFNARQNLDTHLRRHYGVRPFECEVCPEKFFTAQDLKRHMLQHSGQKPFGCRYCDRRFMDSSGRIRHERTHTNERPFMCTQCGKAFTNSYILQNHMLTHFSERNFECELCNKFFKRRTHLVTHYRSTSHKENQEKLTQQSATATVTA